MGTVRPILDFKEIENAKDRLQDVVKETKLIYSNIFSSECGNQVYIKPENLQVTGSFKIRGAYNKISKLSSEDKQKGLIAASAGNHAQGVAFAAQKLGTPAVIVMPKTTPLIKVEATKNLGAEVILHGDCYDEACAYARELEKEKGYIFIHPFDDLDVIAGQGTIGIEILEELKDADYILAAVGGGGLLTGIAVAAKAINPNVKVIGVEPEGSPSLKLSIDSNRIIDLDSVKTIADGAAVKKPGELTFALTKEYVDEIITVSDYELMEAFLILLEKHKLIAENAGVLPLAGVKRIADKDKKVVCVVSGGNIDVLTISSLINRGLVSRGRVFCFTMELPDKPGQLMRVCEILARNNANIIKLDHNQYKTLYRFMQVQLEVTVETNGHNHVASIIDDFQKEGFTINKVY
ncbi:threonine ammonia-lyase [Clostridium thermarum]|uniref:threonine ammonia-lyase n=1 Tax=Clostridium thermarum TaxID=1716543 RepID=UPI0013D5A672|nr:threonine ammonia-lyase [Clostridium thermarum]